MKKKKIAVIIRNRQSEGLRMSVGLTVMDDMVDVFITEKLKDDPETRLQMNGVKEMQELGLINIYSLYEGDGMKKLTIEEMAEKLTEYDNILPY